MQIELSKHELETVLKCVKAHLTTLSAVMIKDTSGLFDNHKKDCEEIYKKLSDTLKDKQE